MTRLGIDIGGTFTDLCLLRNDGGLETRKVLSTPSEPAKAFEQVVVSLLDSGVKPSEIVELVHATTIATNAILEGNMPSVGLVTTRGFRDVIEIGRHVRRDLYNLFLDNPPPLVPRYNRFEIDERVDVSGRVLTPVDEEQLAELALTIRAARLEVVVVCFLHSYAHPAHESQVAKYLTTETDAIVVSSAAVCPEYREYERFSTAVIHGVLRPLVTEYLDDIERRVSKHGIQAPLSVMQSNGGLASASMVGQAPGLVIESGPAAGVIAGAEVGRRIGKPDIITFDMGGTTAKASIIHGGQPAINRNFEVGGGLQGGYGTGYPVQIPVVDLVEVGTGGGSLGGVDEIGQLSVGPRSAGADPGPACYGRGGNEPTITDANLVLGRISPTDFAGGSIDLDVDEAHRVILERIARPLGTDVIRAAEGMVKVANAQMVRTLELVSTERGHDPRNYVMVAFGGAGPMHAVELAWELGCSQVVVPPEAGVQSAWGLLVSDARRDYSRTVLRAAGSRGRDLHDVLNCWSELAAQGVAELEESGFNAAEILVRRSLDARYRGQAYELTVPVEADAATESLGDLIDEAFGELHAMRYGYSDRHAEVEWVTARVEVIASVPRPVSKKPAVADATLTQRRSGIVSMVWDGERHDSPHYRRTDLGLGDVVRGPALISQSDSSIALPPGSAATVGEFGDIIIERQML